MTNSKNIIIVALLIVILVMAVGYSAFASELRLNGIAQITGVWDVKITNIEVKNVSEGADCGVPQFTNTTATFDAKLLKPGDTITYEITIKNEGTIDATLEQATFRAEDTKNLSAIIYSVTAPSEVLLAGEQTSFTVTVWYDEEATQVPEITTRSITGVVEYVQK